jgi:hypothetical protein
MTFGQFKAKMQKHIATMFDGTNFLFVVDIDKDKLWEVYLDSFPTGTNDIYRKKREYDCSACRHFIKSFGNVVTIKNSIITTIWDFEIDDKVFGPVVKALSNFIKSHAVSDIFITRFNTFGIDKNREMAEDKVKVWEHLYIKLPDKFVNISSDSNETIMGRMRDIRNVFKRSLEEISEDAISAVLELINQNSLYKGEEWQSVLKQFLKYHKEYNKLSSDVKENYLWEQSVLVGPVIGKIRNHSIGTLLTDVTNDVDLDEAVRKYEALVAPSNYKRPKAIFTKKMLEEAQKKLEELGLVDSLSRRYATLDDITKPNVLFANKDSAKRMTGNVFDEMSQGVSINPKSFDRIEEIAIDDFIKDVIPTTKKLEVLFENRHTPNLVSLIAPKVKDSKTLFKWNNGFSWAYSGNITDSMKERVKAAGGDVEGVLRFSIQWNDDGKNNNDFDAHCIEPNGNEIFYARKNSFNTSGSLDVDIRNPEIEIENKVAVENITWSDQSRMKEGMYSFFVHNYYNRGGRTGFSAEIEFDGQVFSFEYNQELRQDEKIQVAKVEYSRRDGFKLIELLPSATSSKTAWGLLTNQFYPVSVCMYSPNYWDLQEGIGNRHYFFMLKNCINDESPNGFFNEYLLEEFMIHKRVFEALGSKMRVEDVSDQLSGIGFSSTKRNSLVCRVEGHIKRTLKIIF